MLITTDKELNEEQKRKIEQLEKQWFEELDRLPPLNLMPNELCHAANKPKIDLGNKYLSLIKAVIEEEDEIINDPVN